MQPFQVLNLLILILLTTLVEAHLEAYYGKPQCPVICGDVQITYPFGFGRNCSANEWYTLNCNSSPPYPSSFTNKPYLSAFNNAEVLYMDVSTITINMSMISADCENPVQDINHVLITSHGKSPFRFSGSRNRLVFKGCGSASIMENGSIVTGCSTTCGKDTVSDINNCFGFGCCQTTIPHGLSSFTFNLTGLERQNQDGACGCAFLVDTNYAGSFSSKSFTEDHFVPISLSWNETFHENSTRCNETCGNVSIPSPFGIKRDCSDGNWFNVDCKSLTPYLSAFDNMEVLSVSLEKNTITVNVPMISDCKNPIQTNSLFLTGSPFGISGSDNMFVVEGCGSAAIMVENGTIVGGCSTTCSNDTNSESYRNGCFGKGCCQTTIPYDLESFTLNLTGLERDDGNGSCGSAFLVDKISFNQGRFSRQVVPITLSWTYNTSTSYFRPEVSTECISCEQDGGICFPDRYTTSGMSCHFRGSSNKSLGVILGASLTLGLLILMVISYALYNIIKNISAKRRKQRYFKRNGGLLLKQQQTIDNSLVDKTILFTSNELEKATDHFNDNRILGRGGQGTVYKGMLANGRIVAIKKSKVVDESQLEQFINEVVILSQVNHRNVVKLLGCCLETEVPLLVSEFISNGTLYDFLQDETNEFPISLNMRLQIATEVAGALSYLHSATSIPIYHRDIKTTNILLDEKYRAKVSDFGTSRFVSIDQTHLTTLVKGTFGYLDPEYFQSSQFTEKSDVYSFGVVLLELMTREKPISLTRFGENRSLATYFMVSMEEGRVMSIFDAIVVKEGSRNELLAIANLAMRCLNLNGKNRPTMKEVAIELEGVRLSHVPTTI
ncbi:wall-associated receptor kinase-like 1 [Lactuca sativa]|uniref:Protein kinase domain-containing protein n=1 Tax=Lactuca sativa TaxID=4236 RepID=A0A9R1WGS1_LACSA|nr:wall-associated receptor kinase-like 1 [Lactuca sativa]KAJ0223573.1 hypothetical protein LSAT_V11C200072660 [Lactuca sativa]